MAEAGEDSGGAKGGMLSYMSPVGADERPRAGVHSRFALVAVLAYAVVAAGKLGVWLYGCYRWGPYYRVLRLETFVVDPYQLPWYALWVYAFGVACAFIGLMIRFRRRWLAGAALVANMLGLMACSAWYSGYGYGWVRGISQLILQLTLVW